MLDRSKIHNSAILKPVKHKHLYNEVLSNGRLKCGVCGKLKARGKFYGLRKG